MATRTRIRTPQSAIPLSSLSPNNVAAPSQTGLGSSTGVPMNAGTSLQSGGTTQIQGTSAGHGGSSRAGSTWNTGNAGSAGGTSSTTVSASSPPPAARPEPMLWNWVQRVGGVLGMLGTFVAIIYFFFPYQASLVANKLAANGNTLSNIANDWARWAQCTAPGSTIANATWCRDHSTPDTFDSGFNMARRSIFSESSARYFNDHTITVTLKTACETILNGSFGAIYSLGKRYIGSMTASASIVFTLASSILGIWIYSRIPRGPKLNHDQLVQLLSETHFSKEELNSWYKGFLKDCPSGLLSMKEFQGVYRTFFPAGDPSSFANHVFRVFDTDHSGFIDFREFICALSVTSRGRMDDKLEWAFRLYDIDGDGKISFDEMLVIVQAIYEMVGPMVKLPEGEETPEKRVNKIFCMMDRNQSGSLDMEDFKEGSRRDETIISALSLYDGLV